MIEEKLILDNQNLVYSIINHYYFNYPNKNDLFQAGCLGLVKASKMYDSSLNTKFSSYAYMYILGEIKDYVRKNRSINVSHDMQKLAYKLEKVRVLLLQKYMREPSVQELSMFLNIPEEKIIEILSIPTKVYSLDEPVGDDNLSLYECIGNKENIDIHILLKEELKKLDDNEKKLIQARYMEDMTQSEVSKMMNMSQVQVSRYEKKVLMKLRNRL